MKPILFYRKSRRAYFLTKNWRRKYNIVWVLSSKAPYVLQKMRNGYKRFCVRLILPFLWRTENNTLFSVPLSCNFWTITTVRKTALFKSNDTAHNSISCLDHAKDPRSVKVSTFSERKITMMITLIFQQLQMNRSKWDILKCIPRKRMKKGHLCYWHYYVEWILKLHFWKTSISGANP